MPGEFERHERTIMAWPARRVIWGRHHRQAQLDYAEIARTIAEFEPVTMIAGPDAAATAADLCGSTVDVVEISIDDSWARDSGPLYVVDRRAHRRVVDFRFNAWGEKFLPFADDALLKQRWATLRGEERVAVDLVLEGGAIAVDGVGTLITTEQCLLHPNRNPTRTRFEIESVLQEQLGINTIVWLPFGLMLDDDTNGHVDNVAAFSASGRLIMQSCRDTNEADHDRLAINRRCADGARDAVGQSITVTEVPVLPFVEIDGERICVPYLNFYICNGAVMVPVSGHPADADMLELIGEQFPRRRVLPVPGVTLAIGGGGPHCITQQLPAGTPHSNRGNKLGPRES